MNFLKNNKKSSKILFDERRTIKMIENQKLKPSIVIIIFIVFVVLIIFVVFIVVIIVIIVIIYRITRIIGITRCIISRIITRSTYASADSNDS
jgi:hypothetical protein